YYSFFQSIIYIKPFSTVETSIKLAVQKSGRLSEKSLQIIEDCGISYSRYKSKLMAAAYNFPLELLFLRDDDIPKYVASGVADIGIVGENVLAEKDEKVDLVERMGFSKCRLSIAVPQSLQYSGPQDLNGRRIATSYPHLTQLFLQKHNVKAEIHEISGSVEIAPSIGLAGAVCDLVSTGSTLLSNGLKEVETIFKSEAVMVKNQELNVASGWLLTSNQSLPVNVESI
ncbi:MAG: ATP phosphoribosyltransferase, partial [Pseudomonadota bacterium]